MKTNTTKETGSRAQGQSEQITTPAEFNKYLVLAWQGREQANVFPLYAKHSEVLQRLRQCPEIR